MAKLQSYSVSGVKTRGSQLGCDFYIYHLHEGSLWLIRYYNIVLSSENRVDSKLIRLYTSQGRQESGKDIYELIVDKLTVINDKSNKSKKSNTPNLTENTTITFRHTLRTHRSERSTFTSNSAQTKNEPYATEQ